MILLIYFFNYQMMKLRDWVNIDKLNWENLSLNINAIELLKDNSHKIDWGVLSSNINAIDLLKDNLEKLIGNIYQEIQMR